MCSKAFQYRNIHWNNIPSPHLLVSSFAFIRSFDSFHWHRLTDDFRQELFHRSRSSPFFHFKQMLLCDDLRLRHREARTSNTSIPQKKSIKLYKRAPQICDFHHKQCPDIFSSGSIAESPASSPDFHSSLPILKI